MILFLLIFSSILSASDISLDQHKGKVVYLDFWASWCPPCALSFPWMKALEEKYKDKGLVILTVNLDEEKKDANNFLNKYQAKNLNVIYNPYGNLAEKYKISSMPTSFLYNRNGKLISEHKGFTDEIAKAIEKEILSLLEN